MVEHKIDVETVFKILPPLAGAIVGHVRMRKKDVTAGETIAAIFTGFVTAIYISPVVYDLLHLPENNQDWERGIAFAVGASGFAVIPIIIEFVKRTAIMYMENFNNDRTRKKS